MNVKTPSATQNAATKKPNVNAATKNSKNGLTASSGIQQPRKPSKQPTAPPQIKLDNCATSKRS